jgi:hypothetical protein
MGQSKTVELLIKSKANIEEKELIGKRTPLLRALENRHFKSAEVLVFNGAEVSSALARTGNPETLEKFKMILKSYENYLYQSESFSKFANFIEHIPNQNFQIFDVISSSIGNLNI